MASPSIEGVPGQPEKASDIAGSGRLVADQGVYPSGMQIQDPIRTRHHDTPELSCLSGPANRQSRHGLNVGDTHNKFRRVGNYSLTVRVW